MTIPASVTFGQVEPGGLGTQDTAYNHEMADPGNPLGPADRGAAGAIRVDQQGYQGIYRDH